MKRLLIVAALALSGCPEPYDPLSVEVIPVRSEPAKESVGEPEKESAWIAEMQIRVKNKLRDPSSTQFRNTRLSRSGGIPAVCGEVNSNNAFGGKVGYQRFVSAGNIQVLEEQVADGEMQPVWDKFCH